MTVHIRTEKGRAKARPAQTVAAEELRLFVGAGGAGAAFASRRAGVVAAGGSFLLLFAGFLEQRFARKANLVAFDGKHFKQDLYAVLHFVAHVVYKMSS